MFHVTSGRHFSNATDVERALPRIGALPLGLAYAATGLVFWISVAGVVNPSIYARETPNWTAQAIGQDWVDLLLAVPWLLGSTAAAQRGSRSGVILLAGGLAYAVYELVIYAFALHFNAMFLVYCAALGSALGALLPLGHLLLHEGVKAWFTERAPARGAGIFLLVVGVAFGLLWLAEILPALAHGTVPPSVLEAGVPTNPVYVMDLSLVLPLHVAGGWLLVRKHPWGYLVGPVLLAFGVLMAASIGGMMVVMLARGVAADATVAVGMGFLALVSAALLTRFLQALR